MKIIHIANFNMLKTNGCSQNSTQIKITNGLIRLGHQVVPYSDRDICRMMGFGHMNFWGKRGVNRHLIKFCKAVKPDAIVMGHADTIKTKTLIEIKRLFPGLKILEWGVDNIAGVENSPVEFQKNAEFTLSKLKNKQAAVDIVLLTTGEKKLLSKLKTESNIVGFFPNIVDKSIEKGRSFEQENLPYDLMFAATPTSARQFCGQFVSAQDVARDILNHVPDIKSLFAGLLGAPKINAAEYQNACASCAMGLSLSHVNDVYLYQSDRLAHLMGNGALAFLDARSGYRDFFTDDEIAFYKTPEELYEKIAFYKNNPKRRMQVAKAGHGKYVDLFNEQRVAQYFSDLLFKDVETARVNCPWSILV